MATEKRLIDAIALISKARRMETTDNNGIPVDTFAVPVMAIEDAPTVDAVPVVRCKDCKWYAPNFENSWVGCAIAINCKEDEPNADDYCSYGERKSQ